MDARLCLLNSALADKISIWVRNNGHAESSAETALWRGFKLDTDGYANGYAAVYLYLALLLSPSPAFCSAARS